jgi:hypothetical protein
MRHVLRVHLFCASTDRASREVRTVTYRIGRLATRQTAQTSTRGAA